MMFADTTGAGRFFLTAVGANTRHEGGGARAVNYPKQDGTLAFLLADTVGFPSGAVFERLLLARHDSISGTGMFAIDSLNPQETQSRLPNVLCNPPRTWSTWEVRSPAVDAAATYSHRPPAGTPAGSFSITHRIAVSGGYVIGGRYSYRAQRGDFYFDPNGLVIFHGTFVTPLITTTAPCVQ
jgi:hypothetical protein